MPASGVLRIAQLTDMHIMAAPESTLRGINTRNTFEKVLALPVMDLTIDHLLCTGDCSEDGSEASYTYLKKQLAASPATWVPGNHDDFAMMRQVFGDAVVGDRVMAFDHWVLIQLGSQVAGKVHGEISAAQMTWLKQQLEMVPDKHVMIALHHPPAAIGCEWLDRIGLFHGDEFCQLLADCPSVRCVVAGHAHTDHHQRVNQVDYLISPSTAFQHNVDCDDMQLTQDQPGMRTLDLHPDGSFETQVWRTTGVTLPFEDH